MDTCRDCEYFIEDEEGWIRDDLTNGYCSKYHERVLDDDKCLGEDDE